MRYRMPAILFIAMSSGCIIPLAPEFEDPPATINYAPYIENSLPTLGSEITAPPSGDVSFSLTVSDPNLGDTLYVRWISDYPPYSDDSRQLGDLIEIAPPADGKPARAPMRFSPSCVVHSIARGLTRHRIMVAVSDRKFLPEQTSPELPFTLVPPDAHLIVGTWTLNLECR